MTPPKQTPWGHADNVTKIADGIFSVSTPGHGGLWLAPWRRLTVPALAFLLAPTPYSGGDWFEEDCDWALVCAAFPADFEPEACFYAFQAMASGGDYLPERRAQYRTTEQYQQLKARAALADKIEPKLATV